MENKNTRDVVCKHKDANVFVMTCEEKQETEPALQVVEQEEPTQVAEPVVEEVVDVEEIAVPIVGNIDETEAGAVEPLGETESWYPDTVNYDNVVNYEYGTTTPYVASLTNPEVGFEPSDILLVAIIALSCMAIVGSLTFLTGRAVENRATRKDFIKK